MPCAEPEARTEILVLGLGFSRKLIMFFRLVMVEVRISRPGADTGLDLDTALSRAVGVEVRT